MHLTNEERETIILFNEADKTATCDTCNPSLIRKLDDFCSRSKDITLIRQDEYGKTYKFPKKWVSVRLPKLYDEETKEKMSKLAKERFHKNKQATASDENS